MTTDKEFVLQWIDAHNKEQGVTIVAKKNKLTNQNASARASYLRKRGVNLPHLKRSTEVRYSVEELNRIINIKIK